jgi:hypothetical protein
MTIFHVLKYPLPSFTDVAENTIFLISLPKDLQKNCIRVFDQAASLKYNSPANIDFLKEHISHLLLLYDAE